MQFFDFAVPRPIFDWSLNFFVSTSFKVQLIKDKNTTLWTKLSPFFCFLQLIQFPSAKVIQLFFNSIARNPLQCTRAIFNSFTLFWISIFCSQNNYSRTSHIRTNNNRRTNCLDNRISITRVMKYKEITSHSEKLVDYILNASLMYIG